ncbi:MAG TPA: hypothetical protein VGD31_12585, partial [Sphingobacteriaceae bacterium]
RVFNTQTGKIDDYPYPMSVAEKINVTTDFMDGVEQVLRFRRRIGNHKQLASVASTRTVNYTACQFCHWEAPCTLEAQGKDATYTLATQYTKSSYDYAR